MADPVRTTFPIVASDGASVAAIALGEGRGPVFMLLPALGIAAGYYEPFAAQLAQRTGGTVVLADLRGQGTSDAHPRRADFGYREMLERDFPALFETVSSRFPERPLIVIGHSLGGQLATMYAGHFPPQVTGLVLVASGTTHTAAWEGYRRYAAAAYTAVIRGAARVLPWYPGRVFGFGNDHPRRLIRDWGHVVRTGRYRPEGSAIDYESSCVAATMPVLSVGVGGDQLAPRLARQALVDRLRRAPSQTVEVPRPEGSTNWRAHFAWARRPAHVVEVIATWLEHQPAQRASSESRDALPSASASTSGLADAKSRP